MDSEIKLSTDDRLGQEIGYLSGDEVKSRLIKLGLQPTNKLPPKLLALRLEVLLSEAGEMSSRTRHPRELLSFVLLMAAFVLAIVVRFGAGRVSFALMTFGLAIGSLVYFARKLPKVIFRTATGGYVGRLIIAAALCFGLVWAGRYMESVTHLASGNRDGLKADIGSDEDGVNVSKGVDSSGSQDHGPTKPHRNGLTPLRKKDSAKNPESRVEIANERAGNGNVAVSPKQEVEPVIRPPSPQVENASPLSDSRDVEFVPATYTATAYSLRGRTASGRPVERGLIAADPSILPLGTRVRIEAAEFSGEYVVADTNSAIKGRRIDIWTPTTSEAMKFGRRAVKLTVLSFGGRRKGDAVRPRRVNTAPSTPPG